ncbi:MAG: hypothetical protein GY732_10105, partial [Gammaproteobacteria bacterium]|nr:hypothetical protein [Gammaproteobacteria bacterium]
MRGGLGDVNYYDDYIIGKWFALDPETGEKYWSRWFFRPNHICGYADGV